MDEQLPVLVRVVPRSCFPAENEASEGQNVSVSLASPAPVCDHVQ